MVEFGRALRKTDKQGNAVLYPLGGGKKVVLSSSNKLRFCPGTIVEYDPSLGFRTGEYVDFAGEDEAITCYRLTEAGKVYGRPIAAFALDYVFRTGRSMYQILGSTESHGKSRAPLNRVKILKELQKGKKRLVDLETELDLKASGVKTHLLKLKDIGFVEFDSCEQPNKGRATFSYSWVDGKKPSQVAPLTDYGNLSTTIAKKIAELGKSDPLEVSRVVGCNYSNACRIISYLVKQGVVTPKKWTVKAMSEAWLLPPGEKFLEEVSVPIEEALVDSPALQQMQNAYEDLVASQRSREVCRYATITHNKVSPYKNKKEGEETRGRILAYLIQNPGARPIEIGEYLQIQSIRHHLRGLVESKTIRKEKDKQAVRYYVN